MKVLAIGNSFSSDAMRYLHNIAKADGTEMKTVNLFIGGCPLSRHYANMHNDAADYDFEFNGERTGIKVSIRQALQSDVWDVVTLQQASSLSIDYNTYQPYLGALADYVRIHAPKAKIMLHQTWAYEQDSDRLTKELGYKNQTEMFDDLKSAYAKAAQKLGGMELIPSGEMFQNLIKAGAGHIHRDTFHASLGLGRLALGYVWYETLTGKNCADNSFAEFDEPVTEQDKKTAQTCAHKAAEQYRRI
jgi:hypothetical protein